MLTGLFVNPNKMRSGKQIRFKKYKNLTSYGKQIFQAYGGECRSNGGLRLFYSIIYYYDINIITITAHLVINSVANIGFV